MPPSDQRGVGHHAVESRGPMPRLFSLVCKLSQRLTSFARAPFRCARFQRDNARDSRRILKRAQTPKLSPTRERSGARVMRGLDSERQFVSRETADGGVMAFAKLRSRTLSHVSRRSDREPNQFDPRATEAATNPMDDRRMSNREYRTSIKEPLNR